MTGYQPETIQKLAEINIRSYTNKINSGSKFVRVDECLSFLFARMYLGLWNSIVQKGYDWDKLTKHEQKEVKEAAMDEEIPPDLDKKAPEA